MNRTVEFVIKRAGTKSFWMMVTTTFLGILMYDMRSKFRDQVFQDAILHSQKTGWDNWNPKNRFN
jgi:hypothetical protein